MTHVKVEMNWLLKKLPLWIENKLRPWYWSAYYTVNYLYPKINRLEFIEWAREHPLVEDW